MEKGRFIPTTKKEIDALGWDYVDVIIFTGDAYIDHPSFGTAVIARVLESNGYRVAVVPQPNWRDDLRDFKKLGAPSLLLIYASLQTSKEIRVQTVQYILLPFV